MPEFREEMRKIVAAPDFLDGNFLSTELRVPSTLMQTNVCSPIATNAIAGNVWDNFSSQAYKQLPPVGTVKLRHPLSGAEYDFPLPGGGRGFTRPASLVSLWSSAPFLQNNSVGPFEESPSVEARMRVFQASIEQMLWPERREKDKLFRDLGIEGAGVGIIQRTQEDSHIRVPSGYIPAGLRPLLAITRGLAPALFRDGEVFIGPIPKGTPVSLLSSMDLGADMPERQRKEHMKKLIDVVKEITEGLKRGTNPFADRNILEKMLALSKCPDFVINKGHYFGTDLLVGEPGLSDADKRALIAFLKMM